MQQEEWLGAVATPRVKCAKRSAPGDAENDGDDLLADADPSARRLVRKRECVQKECVDHARDACKKRRMLRAAKVGLQQFCQSR